MDTQEHNAWNLFLHVARQSHSVMLVAGFLEDEETREDSSGLSSFCGSPGPGDVRHQRSEDCWKVEDDVLK